MTLAAFQRALATLVASPTLTREFTAAPARWCADFGLSPREARRLAAVAAQRGMSVNCSLYRANRLEAIYTLLPSTCVALGEDLRATVDAYWDRHAHTTLQFRDEVDRFAAFLDERLRRGVIANPAVRDVLEAEIASSRAP